MGTWNLQFEGMKEIFSKPILARDAIQTIQNHIGNDALFDELDELKETDPTKDVRFIIKLHLEDILVETSSPGWMTVALRHDINLLDHGESNIQKTIKAFTLRKSERTYKQSNKSFRTFIGAK
jgi:hypothetical protein